MPSPHINATLIPRGTLSVRGLEGHKGDIVRQFHVSTKVISFKLGYLGWVVAHYSVIFTSFLFNCVPS